LTDTIAILRECGAFLEGHFLLSSGRHSDRYFQCARLLRYPDRAAAALERAAGEAREALRSGALKADAVVGPAMGGIVVAYELGRQLGLPAFFTERDEAGRMALRRGFEADAGVNVIIAEDVVTTGKSSAECAAVLEAFGANISAIFCVVDRRDAGDAPLAGGLDRLPLFSAAKLSAEIWEPSDCPLCRQRLPFVKPGSRKK
jgi:orotate phosphoribosyltransferase